MIGKCSRSRGRCGRAGDHEWQAQVLGGLGDACYARCRMNTSLDCFRRWIALCRDHELIRTRSATALWWAAPGAT